MSLQGATVLVTGADGGLGRAISDAFTEAGSTVIRHANEARPAHVQADFTEPDGIRNLADHVRSRVDSLDVLVNNAGYEVRSGFDDLELDVLERVMRVNALAPVLLLASLSSLLRQSRLKAVINITSMHDHVPLAGNAPYAMSKAALSMATRCAALAYGQDGIRVNAVAPGAIRTPMNDELVERLGTDFWAERVPLGGVGSPTDVAGTVLFLASREAAYITGATFVVDGGYSSNLVRYPEVTRD